MSIHLYLKHSFLKNYLKPKFLYSFVILFVLAIFLSPLQTHATESSEFQQSTPINDLAQTLKVGDLVFIRVSAKPFREVADATETWTNHVGIVTEINGQEPLIGESTFPFSRTTTLSKFVARSEQGHIAVTRLKSELTPEQIQRIQTSATERSGIFYDTGFNLHSHREFCSRYVYEIVKESTGKSIGKIETFKEMFAHNPNINVGFWKIWYFGQIPWDRQTITPASLLNSSELNTVFTGTVKTTNNLS